MKRSRMRRFTAIACAMCMICGLTIFAGCGEKTDPPTTGDPLEGMELPSTTNDRHDSTENQLSYQTNSMIASSIDGAYEKGWLTKTDLAYAMYYALGEVYMCTEAYWEKNKWEGVEAIEFTPTEQCPEIDKQVELDIKRCRYDGMPQKGDLTFEEFAENYSFRFVGSYNGTFVITDESSAYWDYPTDVPPPRWIAGFVWYGHYNRDLFAYRYE